MISEAHEMAGSAVEIANREGYFWGDASAYFGEAERNIDEQWTNIVAPFIGDLAYQTVLDLASGHGRNARRLAEKAGLVTCVDVNPENIAFLKRRFAGDARFAAVR